MEQWFRAVDQDNSGQIDAKELGQAGVSLEYVDICAHTHIAPTYISIIKFLFFFLGQALANGDGSMFSEEACRLRQIMMMMMVMMMVMTMVMMMKMMMMEAENLLFSIESSWPTRIFGSTNSMDCQSRV